MHAALDPNYAGYIKKYYGHEQSLSELFPGSQVLFLDTLTAIVYLPIDRGGEPSIERFGYNSIPKLFTGMDYGAASAAGVIQLRSIPALQLTGKGTLVGILDSGIDLRPQAFRDVFGRTRVVRLWDMADESGSPPELFDFGSEYTGEQLDALLFSGNRELPGADPTGHGTRLAGIAAGSELPDQFFTGMAPEADLVVVKVKEAKPYLKEYYQVNPETACYSEVDLLLALRYIVRTATKLQKPVSIIMGMGSGLGNHSGTDPLSLYLTRSGNAAGAAVSVAAGNQGNQAHHYAGSARSGETTDVQIRVGEQVSGFTMELWGTVPNSYTVAVRSPSGDRVPIPSRGRNADIPIDFLFENTKIYVDYVRAEEESGLPLIQMRFAKPAQGIWTIEVTGQDGNDALTWQMWLPVRELVGGEVVFLEPSPEITITEPGNAASVITVAAYDSAANILYLDNGRGFTLDNRIAPAITAPGVSLRVPSPGISEFVTASGTSLAAGVCGGCAALLLEWGIVLGREPLLTGVSIRNYLIRGAVRDQPIRYPDRQWGYGTLNIYQTFLSLRG